MPPREYYEYKQKQQREERANVREQARQPSRPEPTPAPSGPPVSGPHPGGQGTTGQSGGAAGSGLVPVTSIVPAGVGGGAGTVTTMVPVDQAPISAGGPGPGIEGISDIQDLFPILGEEEETILPEEETIIDKVKKAPGILQNLAADWGGGVVALLMKAILGNKPTKEQLADPNFLAMMFDQLGKKEGAVDQFVEDYKGTMLEALGGSAAKDMSDADLKAAFKSSLENAKQEAIDSGIFQGSEAQRRLEPWNYYDPKLYKTSGEQEAAMEGYPKFLTDMGLKPMSSRFANTMGNLEDIANIPVTAKMQGENPDFVRQIFEAREAISRQKDAQDRRDGGGGAGIMGAVPTPFTDVNNNGILDSLEVAQATTTPAATTTVPAAATTAMATEPIPIDYSQWPQYPGYPTYGPAGGPVPNYVNQGLGVSPHFDYWNQIARTFPGMR